MAKNVPGRTADEIAFERELQAGLASTNENSSVAVLDAPEGAEQKQFEFKMPYEEACESMTPIARQIVAHVATERQYNTKQPRPVSKYRVVGPLDLGNGKTGRSDDIVDAFDEIDAIARANEINKTIRGPRGIVVTKVA